MSRIGGAPSHVAHEATRRPDDRQFRTLRGVPGTGLRGTAGRHVTLENLLLSPVRDIVETYIVVSKCRHIVPVGIQSFDKLFTHLEYSSLAVRMA